MTNYAIPTHMSALSVRIRQLQNIKNSRSLFSFAETIQDNGGQQWGMVVEFPDMTRADADIWTAFLSKLKGPYHTFTMGDQSAATPKGEAGGTPLVNGASQTGASLIIDGCSLSQTDWLKAGDYFQLGTGEDARMFRLTDDADTDSGGNVTLNFWPEITTTGAPSDNDAVTVTGAVCAWRQVGSTFGWEVDDSALHRFRIDAQSAVT